MAENHWGLLGEPPSEVQVIVSGPATSLLSDLAAAVTARRRPRIMIGVAITAALISVALTLAISRGGGAISPGGPLGSPLRCFRSSAPCMTRGSISRQEPGRI